jgi:hypothetical protein
MYSDARDHLDQEHVMKLSLAALVTAAVALVVPAAATAQATLTASPDKPCFGSGDRVSFRGTGFTPGGIVDFTRDGEPVDPRAEPITAGADGTVGARLTVFNLRGVVQRSYAATDRTNPTITAATSVTVSELDVNMRPLGGEPTEPRRIAAEGFTGGETLWAHIVFKGRVRNVRIGRLKGACRRLTRRKRLFGADPGFGRHLIHFDTQRRFRRGERPEQRVSFRFQIFGTSNPGAATASKQIRP